MVIPALDGYVGILANRAPMAAVVGTGLMTLEIGESTTELFVSRGFLQVRDNQTDIYAEECMPPKELDPEEAWNQLQQAYKLPSDTEEEVELRDEAIFAGRTKFALAQKIRKELAKDDGGEGDGPEAMFSKGL